MAQPGPYNLRKPAPRKAERQNVPPDMSLVQYVGGAGQEIGGFGCEVPKSLIPSRTRAQHMAFEPLIVANLREWVYGKSMVPENASFICRTRILRYFEDGYHKS